MELLSFYNKYSTEKRPPYSTLFTPRICSVYYRGVKDVFDIEVEGEFHNFIANGFVVHNSRAIPFEKMVEVVEKEPFVPIAWQLSHKGMQGTEYITDPKVIEFKKMRWLNARNGAVDYAKSLVNDDITIKKLLNTSDSNELSKNYGNRLLEPFMWVTQVVTGGREAFENLFWLRCPIYEIDYSTDNGMHFQTYYGKSKKEILKYFKDNKIFFEKENKDDLWWLQHNKGQAEIHFMDLAEKMYDALNESKPNELKAGEWHIPFSNEPCFTPEMSLKDKIVLSCAMIARTSYTKIADSQNISFETAYKIFNKCKKEKHYSIFEHAGRCMTKEEWEANLRCTAIYEFFKDGLNYNIVSDCETKGWNKAFRGFLQLRTFIEEDYKIK